MKKDDKCIIKIKLSNEKIEKLNEILDRIGLTFDEVVSLFLKEVIRQKKIPFDYESIN